MRWALSTVTTRRSWLISFTVRVLGTSTSMPDCRMGAVIMKMMSSTRTTSTKGTMLISESEVCVDLESCIVRNSAAAAGCAGRENLTKRFFDLRGDFHGEVVQSLRQVANILQELVVEDDGGNGGGQTRSRGHECLGDTGRDGTKARSSGAAEAREGVNDAPDRAEKADEWGDRTSGGKPGHALFDAANLFRGGELHADGDCLQAFQFGRMWISSNATDLGLEFAITGCIHGRK